MCEEGATLRVLPLKLTDEKPEVALSEPVGAGCHRGGGGGV